MYRYFSCFMGALTCALSSLLLLPSSAIAQDAGQAAYNIGNKQNESKRYDEARISFKAACDAGNVKGCAKYAGLLERGRGGAKDLETALRLYTSACAKGDIDACAGKGAVYDKRKNYVKALPLYVAACEKGAARGCTNGGYMYEKGLGTAIDYERSFALYTKSCSLDSGFGCHNAAVSTRDGFGPPADKEVAALMFARNCDQRKYANSCYSAALLAPKTGREEKRFKYAKAGCDLGNENSCHTVAMIYYRRMKSAATIGGISSNKRVALQYYKKACDMGRTKSCDIKLVTTRQETAIKNREIRRKNNALTQEWAAKSKAAKRELNAYRPRNHGCSFPVYQVYSDNQSSIDNSDRILSNDFACIKRYKFNEISRLNTIMTRYGGTVKLKNVTNKSLGQTAYTWTKGCKCIAELEAANDRLYDATDKLMARLNKRVSTHNKILRNGW